MTTLKDAAQAASQASSDRDRERRRKEREASLDKVLEKWDDQYSGFGRLAKDGFVAELPERDAFEHVPYPGIRTFSMRNEKVHGWRIEVDGVPFLFASDSKHGSLWLIHECPLCNVTGASTFFDLSGLGRLLANGPAYGHHCWEQESREVAYQIGSSARDTQLSPDKIVALAFENHSDLIYRLTTGR